MDMNDMLPENIDESGNKKNNEKRVDRIEALKQRLIATKDIKKIRPDKVHKLTSEAFNVSKNWSNTGTEVMKKNLKHPTFFKKFFMFSFLALIASLAFAYIYLSTGGNLVTNKKIDLEVLGNSFVSGGEKANFDIIILNKNSVNLELASLLIKYDKGVGVKIPASDRIQIGTILPGETKRLPYVLPIIGQEGDIKDIVFDLEYRIPGSNALFVKTVTNQITLRSSVLGIGIDASSVSSPNQPFTLKVSLSPNGSEVLKNIALRVEYPTGFTFKGSTPGTFSSNNIWYLGDLTSATPQTISITGDINGFNDEERVFRFYAGEFDKNSNDISPVYVSKIHSVILNKPFLSAKINEDATIIPIQANQTVPVTIIWQNNTEQSIRDIEITASLNGTAYDPSTVNPRDGGEFYNDRGVIVWDNRTSDALSLANSGESGSVTFTFVPKSPISITSPNKEVSVTVSIKGTPVDSVSEIKEVTSIDSRTYKLGTTVSLDQGVVYASGPFKNLGTLQPKIGSMSSYTLLWTLSNTDSLVSGTVVRATLNKNFEWLGETLPGDESVSYNPSSREIIWNVGDLSKNPAPNIRRQVYLKLGITAKQAQFGEVPIITDRTALSGTDTVNGSQINQNKGPLKLNSVDGQEIRVSR
jgi:hypothetical protein